MARQRLLINGEPGERWVNEGSRALYQFFCNLSNTCGACLQYHHQIAYFWPIPLHRNCRCQQRIIMPGQTAPKAFVDFRELLADMPHDQQVAAVGASNYRLIASGAVRWEDVVMKGRVRTLKEVVALQKLSIREMESRGVKPWTARRAYETVHTPEADLIRAHRAELIAKLEKAGVPQDELIAELSRTIAGRATIVGPGLPPGGQTTATFLPPQPGHGGALAAILAGGPRPTKPARPAPQPAPAQKTHREKIDEAIAEQRRANEAHAQANPVVDIPQTTSSEIRVYEMRLREIDADIKGIERKRVEGAPRWKELSDEVDKCKGKMFDYSLSDKTRKKWEKRFYEIKNGEEWQRLESDVKYADPKLNYERNNEQEYRKKLEEAKAKLKPVRVEYAKNQAAHPNLLPPGKIADRIATYKAGDAKADAIVSIDKTFSKREISLAQARVGLNKKIDADQLRFAELFGKGVGTTAAEDAEMKAIDKRLDIRNRALDQVKTHQKAHADEKRKALLAPLEIDPADRLKFKFARCDPGAASSGGPLSPPTTDTFRNAIDATDWLSQVTASGDGHFAKTMELKIGEAPGRRAHHSSNVQGAPYNIQVKTGEKADVIIHEFGHAIDESVAIGSEAVLKRSLEFLDHRLKGQQPIQLKTKFPWFDADEFGADDEFGKVFSESSAYYVGKDYRGYASEVVSMGVQQLYKDPATFAKNDPEYFKFITGILDGSLR